MQVDGTQFCMQRAPLLIALLAVLSGVNAKEKSASPSELSHVLNTDGDDQKRLSALRQLEETSPPDAKQITRSLADTSAAIRAEIIRLALPLIATDDELQIRLLALANDRSESVRLQLLKFIQHFNHPLVNKSLLRILTLQVGSKAGNAAAQSALQGSEWETLKRLLGNPDFNAPTEAHSKILHLLTTGIATIPESMMELLDFIASDTNVPPGRRVEILRAACPRENDAKLPLPRKPDALSSLTSSPEAEIRDAARKLESQLVWPEFPSPRK
jgi:hypothetical protein